MKSNIIVELTDSYKIGQHVQYPPNTKYVYSYVESRGGEFDNAVIFGMQGFIKEYLLKNPITPEMIDEAESIFIPHGIGDKFNREGWEHIVNEHKGMLPVCIRAVKEGTVLPVKNVIATIVNTDPKCFWLTSYIETAFLRAIWYGTTIASRDLEIKNIIREYMKQSVVMTDDEIESALLFKLHDFGCRGVSSNESAQIGAAAHLINFVGTDTLSSLLYLRRNYNADMAGFSINASEHSTITSWTKEKEKDAYQNMIDQFAQPGKMFACVSDSYNIFNAIRMWGDMKEQIIERGATLVIRPDSGLPSVIVPQCLRLMSEVFGYTINDKGYKVLPDYVRLIQGDGINQHSIAQILHEAISVAKFSAENITFGMGGALLQIVNRDDMRFAMKCSAISLDGETWIDVYKDPITDPGKSSKKGLVSLFRNPKTKEYYSEGRTTNIDKIDKNSELSVIYHDGELKQDYTFEEIRQQVNK